MADRDGVSPRHGWMPGPHGHALAVTWLEPRTVTRATVLLVRSVGHDDDATTHGVHHLAELLAAAGHPTVLLNLSGTGQSFGPLDGGAPARWIDEVASVAARLAGDAPGGLVVGGHRVGALVAAHALARPEVPRPGAVLLWHLPAGGRRFVRELRIMAAAQQTAAAPGGAGGVQIGAHRYGEEVVAAIEALPLPPPIAAGVRVHVVAPARTEAGAAIIDALGGAGAIVTTASDVEDWVAAGGADDLVLPVSTAASFVEHLAAVPPGERSGVPRTAADAGVQPVAQSPDGTVVEEILTFRDGHLAGVLSRPRGAASATAFVLLSARGPGDAFVDTARAQAVAGRASLRFDLSGFGMNAPRPGRAPGEIYTATAAQDVALGIEEVHRLGHERAVVVGFCAGGWAALRARPRIAPAVVVAINVELFARDRPRKRPPSRDRSRGPGRGRALRRALRRARAAWQKAERRFHVRPASARWIDETTARGSVVELVYDEHDAGYAYLRSSVDRHLRRSRDPGRVRITTFPALGHFTEGPDGPAMLAHLAAVADRAAAEGARG